MKILYSHQRNCLVIDILISGNDIGHHPLELLLNPRLLQEVGDLSSSTCTRIGLVNSTPIAIVVMFFI